MLSSTYLIAACKVGRGTTALREFNGLLLLLFSAESVPADDEAIVASHKVLFCATIYWRGERGAAQHTQSVRHSCFVSLFLFDLSHFPRKMSLVSGERRCSFVVVVLLVLI